MEWNDVVVHFVAIAIDIVPNYSPPFHFLALPLMCATQFMSRCSKALRSYVRVGVERSQGRHLHCRVRAVLSLTFSLFSVHRGSTDT